MPLNSITLFLVLAIEMLVLNISLALAQTTAQHDGPGGPKEKVDKFVNRYGRTLPPPTATVVSNHDRHLTIRRTVQEKMAFPVWPRLPRNGNPTNGSDDRNALRSIHLSFRSAAKRTSPGILGVNAMTIKRTAVLTALVVSAVPAFDAFSSGGIAMAQLAPSDPDARRPTVCTEQYAPVCGRLNSVLKTYPNACYARVAGADVIAQGACTGAVVRPNSR